MNTIPFFSVIRAVCLRNVKKLVLAVVAVSAVGVSARTFDLALWRGETAAARLPDFCEIGAAPAGWKVRVGAIEEVRYAPQPHALERRLVCDRVNWSNPNGSPRAVEVSVPPTATAGVYNCGMMRVRVVDRVLPPPSAWKYYLDLWQHPWAVARLADVKPFSPGHYAAMRPVYELLATAGQKTITVTICDEPWDHQCRDAYHSLVADGDFGRFDEYVAFARSCGLGPDIACYSLCPWTLGASVDESRLESRWGAFLDRFAAHLKEKGWYGDAIMAMDERDPADVRKIVDFVRRHAPGMRISMAGNRKPSDFKGTRIDVYAQILTQSNLTPEFLAEVPSRRRDGLVTTFYVCCWPNRPNTFVTSAPGEAFWCGVAPAMLGLDGFLRWAWNSWPEDPVRDASYGGWTAGDTFLCYPGGQPSWRFLELRNGIATAEKLRLLKVAGTDPEGLAAIAARYSVGNANAGRCNWMKLREDAMDFVNR